MSQTKGNPEAAYDPIAYAKGLFPIIYGVEFDDVVDEERAFRECGSCGGKVWADRARMTIHALGELKVGLERDIERAKAASPDEVLEMAGKDGGDVVVGIAEGVKYVGDDAVGNLFASLLGKVTSAVAEEDGPDEDDAELAKAAAAVVKKGFFDKKRDPDVENLAVRASLKFSKSLARRDRVERERKMYIEKRNGHIAAIDAAAAVLSSVAPPKPVFSAEADTYPVIGGAPG